MGVFLVINLAVSALMNWYNRQRRCSWSDEPACRWPPVWLRRNLFAGVWSTLLTVAMVALLAFALPPLVRWGVTNAVLWGQSRAVCTENGACWAFITRALPVLRLRLATRSRNAGGRRWSSSCSSPSPSPPSASDRVAHALGAAARHPVPAPGRRPALGRRARPRLCRHVPVGRADGQLHAGLRRRGRLAAARHPAGPRPALAAAGGAELLRRLHRAVARRAAADRALHGDGDAAAVPAGGRPISTG